MSERIYAWLLHLFPPHFREAYGEAALQLFRDRSRNERGFFPTVRLWLDLLGDLTVSLPREHRRNVPRPALAQRNPDDMPSFHPIEGQAPRLGALMLGSGLSLLALGTFPGLISGGGNHRPIRSLAVFSEAHDAGRAPAAVNIPDTPAGKVLRAWLEAFNSADPAKIERFQETFDPAKMVLVEPRFRRQTGGFDLLSVTSKTPLLLTFRVKEKNSLTEGMGSISIKDLQSLRVASFAIRALPAGAVLQDMKLDAEERKRVVNAAISNLNDYYIYPDVAQKMADALVAHQNAGDYEPQTDGAVFADVLTKQLQDVSHDKHLRVIYSPFKTPDREPSPLQDNVDFRKQLERENCSFEKLEILPNNIGYLKFNGFPPPSLCQPTAVAAMAFLAHVDAVIFDLRDNHGGDPNMVAFLATYLFDGKTHLNDLFNRHENTTEEYWTLPAVPGKRLADKPVYVLTSGETFSGAEEFCYDLKNLKRATIVGEATGGGAHLTSGHRIDDHFEIGVPSARAINPISKTDWEGTGVAPDVKVKAADALITAERLAAEKLKKE